MYTIPQQQLLMWIHFALWRTHELSIRSFEYILLHKHKHRHPSTNHIYIDSFIQSHTNTHWHGEQSNRNASTCRHKNMCTCYVQFCNFKTREFEHMADVMHIMMSLYKWKYVYALVWFHIQNGNDAIFCISRICQRWCYATMTANAKAVAKPLCYIFYTLLWQLWQ